MVKNITRRTFLNTALFGSFLAASGMLRASVSLPNALSFLENLKDNFFFSRELRLTDKEKKKIIREVISIFNSINKLPFVADAIAGIEPNFKIHIYQDRKREIKNKNGKITTELVRALYFGKDVIRFSKYTKVKPRIELFLDGFFNISRPNQEMCLIHEIGHERRDRLTGTGLLNTNINLHGIGVPFVVAEAEMLAWEMESIRCNPEYIEDNSEYNGLSELLPNYQRLYHKILKKSRNKKEASLLTRGEFMKEIYHPSFIGKHSIVTEWKHQYENRAIDWIVFIVLHSLRNKDKNINWFLSKEISLEGVKHLENCYREYDIPVDFYKNIHNSLQTSSKGISLYTAFEQFLVQLGDENVSREAAEKKFKEMRFLADEKMSVPKSQRANQLVISASNSRSK